MTDKYDEYPVNSIETGNAVWTAWVNKGGWFRASHPQHGDIQAESYSGLEEKARRASSTGRVKVSIPVAQAVKYRDGWRIEAGEATGIHGSSGYVLIRNAKGKSEQASHGVHTYFSPPSEGDALKMAELLNIRDSAERDFRSLEAKYKFAGGLTQVVQDEVDRVRKGAAE